MNAFALPGVHIYRDLPYLDLDLLDLDIYTADIQ